MVVCALQGRIEDKLCKKIIKGIVYDTETSRELGSHYDKFFGETDTLYVTQEEEYFLTFGKRNIVPLNDKALLKYWIAKILMQKHLKEYLI